MVDEAYHDSLFDEDIVAIDGEGDPIFIDAEAALARGVIIEPTVGITFIDEDEAYDYYNKYTKLVGFAIRKGRTIWKHGRKIGQIIECCRQGFRNQIYGRSENARPYTKCGCQASIRIKKNEK
ncbi:protein FAR1-RELATED SEQUENCE 8-like [Amborella trichopoda]|uniref:protein FAR1-RELATED SEQUENCE 8-like n=1 Tax=Amborella trichopoda TaxID=13333 RepID=UPI0009BF4529|nr:protein FAR1-RELATED SEQUENCE 8-like [Amborella trichopoda]|eukprot:XP_020517778.1 protein FAR1-RELATED SEQUENCE 8-like [Amborella trichopoda]